MNEAKKLTSSEGAGDTPLSHEPELGLEDAVPQTAEAVSVAPMRQPVKSGRASGTMLILFLIGLVAFVAGVALAGALTAGLFDSGWIKDTMHSLKEMLHHK